MLTEAIGLLQTTQLLCFTIIFFLMARSDRSNQSLRWLTCAYTAGLIGNLLLLVHPAYLSRGLALAAVPIAYACLHAAIVQFTGRGRRTRWISVVLIAGAAPCYLLWSSNLALLARSQSLADLTLILQSALTAWLLFSTHDPDTVTPRRAMGAFLSLFSAVELARVVVFVITGTTPNRAVQAVEIVTGIVSVVSCSILPLAFIWMFNARLYARMSHENTSDPLTHLLNRRGLQLAVERELARYHRNHLDIAIVVVDIDYFKRLNDTFGHAGGDLVLQGVATLLRDTLRAPDTIGRLGGEEFVLLLPDTPLTGAHHLVERLRATFEGHVFPIASSHARITSSFGITSTNGRTGLTWETLLHEADLALYAAKRDGRNLTRIYNDELPDPLRDPVRDPRTLTTAHAKLV
jgi:diguanylate cyclase (GGDEF)-like protein